MSATSSGPGVVERRLAELSPWERNPRRISGERLESLKRALSADREMLDARPLVALPDGRVICGNQRLVAASELGWKTIPTITVDLDETRARLWALRDNSQYGDWDDTLGLLLAELAEQGADLDLSGFTPALLEELISAATATTPVDPDEVPEPPGEPSSRLGEVYQLGRHRLLCGDATQPDQLAVLTGDAEATVVWTDPPYGVGYTGKTGAALTIANDDADGVQRLLLAALNAAETVLAPSAPFYVAAPAGPQGTVFRTAIAQAGWRFHQALVWVKHSLVLGHSDYHYQHEDILYGWAPGPGRPGRGRQRGSRWYGDNSQTTVFFVDRPARSTDHPPVKPVALVEQQLRNSSRRGEVVLDPFAGSGTTLIAAEKTGRACYAVELDPAYCDVIRSRYDRYQKGGS